MGSYVPGDGLAVVAPQLAVLLPGGDVATAREVHIALAAGAGATQVLQVIAAGVTGFGEWPAFAVVAWRESSAQVFVRGDLTVRVEGADGVVTVEGTDVITWREERVADAERCELGRLDGLADALPIGFGVVRADGLVLAPGGDPAWGLAAGMQGEHGAQRTARDGAPAPSVVPPAPVGLVAVDPDLARPDEPSGGAPDTASEVGPAAAKDPAQGDAQEGTSPRDARPLPAGADALISDVPGIAMTASTLSGYTSSTLPPEPGPEPGPGATYPAAAPEADETGYDHLWGMTRKGRVEDAAIRLEPEAGHGEAGGGPAAPAASGVAASDDPLHDGMTIGPAAMAELRRARAAQAAAPPGPAAVPGGHGVLARVCLSGHSNPPERSECWVCGRQVAGEATRRARPPLGRLRLATGEVVELDGPYVVGRRPKTNRVQGEVPRVLAVPSPEGEVSASHLALRLEDWHVLAEDQSRNGTILYREGEDPRRLQPHVPMIMRSGDVLDLGDGAVLTFEGLP